MRLVEEHIISLMQQRRDGSLWHGAPDHLEDPLLVLDRVLDLPGAALGPQSIGRDDENDSVGLLDQSTEPCFPVLAGDDILRVDVGLETAELQPGHELERERRIIARIGDEDPQSGIRDGDGINHTCIPRGSGRDEEANSSTRLGSRRARRRRLRSRCIPDEFVVVNDRIVLASTLLSSHNRL